MKWSAQINLLTEFYVHSKVPYVPWSISGNQKSFLIWHFTNHFGQWCLKKSGASKGSVQGWIIRSVDVVTWSDSAPLIIFAYFFVCLGGYVVSPWTKLGTDLRGNLTIQVVKSVSSATGNRLTLVKWCFRRRSFHFLAIQGIFIPIQVWKGSFGEECTYFFSLQVLCLLALP